jgi:hypothetical protein
MSVIPAFGTLRQDDQELQASLDYIARYCLQNKQNFLILKVVK